jgi:hypothetical protein
MSRNPIQLEIEDDGLGPDREDSHTVGDALADIAIGHCLQRDPKTRTGHVRAMILFKLNEDRALGRAVTAAASGHPNYDDPGSPGPPTDLNDWQRSFWDWGYRFYLRMAAARGLRLSPAVVEQRALAFASALASLVRPYEWRCLNAGQNERPPHLDGYGVTDPLLNEPASGRRKTDVVH